MAMLLQVAEVKVQYLPKPSILNQPKVHNSSDAEKILRFNWSSDIGLIEEFNVLFLNRANNVKGILRLSRGGLTGTVADPRILFAAALKGLASGIIAGHNHPSGNLKPSSQDIELTKKLKEIEKLHDIQLIDHIILAPHSGFYSFADEGML
ncbi:MAG: JAB domain-containing protein [Saprospiraceae bacterium]|nr:JAB domain-containing protein [Saprospiraceae bacterium]